MHFIIELPSQLEKLQPTQTCFVQVISNNPRYHPKLSWVSLVYYHNGDKGYIICVKHSEAFTLDIQRVTSFLQSHKTVWVYDKKWHSYFLPHDNLKDIHLNQLAIDGNITKLEYETSAHRCMDRSHWDLEYLSEVVPISKHYEKWEKVYNSSKKWMDNSVYPLDVSIPYKKVEESGIGVCKNVLDFYDLPNPQFSIRGSRAHTLYNLYNPTGRPTNSFNGINYLAIPKNEDVRSCIVPTNDYFVEFDFDAYHPRLVAKELGIELPSTSLHEYFAKLYFNKEEISQEEYQTSKEITFKQMYGGVLDEYKSIEFFNKMETKISQLGKEYSKNGYVILPTGIRVNKTKGMNPMKLFNYWVQNLETLNNYYFISKINNILEDKHSKLILITYDAFLVDFSVKDGKGLLKTLKDALQENGMVVKHKWGQNYNL